MKDMWEEDSVQGLMVQTMHRYQGMCFRHLQNMGIHPGQFPVLVSLYMHPGMSQKELAARLNIKPPTVNVTVKRLESGGYVLRKQDEKDFRSTRIYLTEKGNSIMDKGKYHIHRTEEVMTRGFTESELCLMRRFFKQMLHNMEQIEEGVDEKK